MSNEKPCTYIMWAHGIDLDEAFRRVCSPVQGSGYDVETSQAFTSGFSGQSAEPKNMAVVHKPIEEVLSLAEKLGQKGLILEPGFYR